MPVEEAEAVESVRGECRRILEDASAWRALTTSIVPALPLPFSSLETVRSRWLVQVQIGRFS